MPQRLTKLAQLKQRWHQADFLGALRIAAKFPNLGREKEAIQRGWAAHINPEVYRQMGQDPGELLVIAYGALEGKYRLGEHVDA